MKPQHTRLYTRGAMRFEANGTLDVAFTAMSGDRSDGGLHEPPVCQPGWAVFMSGLFNAVDGKPRPGNARENQTGSQDHSFRPWCGS